jgi:hypothetical protein
MSPKIPFVACRTSRAHNPRRGVSARQLEKRATLRYGLPPKLVPIIAHSGYWGRIKEEMVCAMTSKYAMALYGSMQLRANLNRCVETIEIGRFRDMLGVPPGAYKARARLPAIRHQARTP